MQFPDLPTVYDKTILRRAYEWHMIEEAYPWNPRCLHINSLLDIDMVWVDEYERYRLAVQYYIDYAKRPAAMRE